MNLNSPIPVIGRLDTKRQWAKRNELIFPLRDESVELLQQSEPTKQSLGIIRVRKLLGLELESQEGGWTPKQLVYLRRQGLFDRELVQLDRPYHRFYYRYLCENPSCRGHRMQIHDWEVIQSYRKWSNHYGDQWEDKFRQKFEDELSRKDLHLYLGTMMKRPKTWIIIGIYYPPVQA